MMYLMKGMYIFICGILLRILRVAPWDCTILHPKLSMACCDGRIGAGKLAELSQVGKQTCYEFYDCSVLF